MNIKKVIPTGMLLASLLFSAVPAYAADTHPWYQTLIERIAQKFGLKQSDVQQVVDDVRTEHREQMEKTYEEKLSQLVADGKITDAQKKLIIDKHTELKNKREQNRTTFQNLSNEEKRTQMQKERDELETWAKQNNIDIQYLFGLGKHAKGLGGMGRGMW